MTQLETTQLGTLEEPVPIPNLPFAQTIDLAGRTARPGEPSPCLPSATSVWYSLRPGIAGRLVVDLAGSTPLDPVVRVYRSGPAISGRTDLPRLREPGVERAAHARRLRGRGRRLLLVQVGTSESREGRLVVRVELRG